MNGFFCVEENCGYIKRKQEIIEKFIFRWYNLNVEKNDNLEVVRESHYG